MCKCVNVQVCKCVSVQMCKCEECKCASLRMCKCAYVQMCKCANKQVCKSVSRCKVWVWVSFLVWARDLWRSALFIQKTLLNMILIPFKDFSCGYYFQLLVFCTHKSRLDFAVCQLEIRNHPSFLMQFNVSLKKTF